MIPREIEEPQGNGAPKIVSPGYMDRQVEDSQESQGIGPEIHKVNSNK